MRTLATFAVFAFTLLSPFTPVRAVNSPSSPQLDEGAQAEKLMTALLNGEGPSGVQKLLDQGLNINSRIMGLSLYQATVLRGDSEMLGFLAQHGAITNAPMPPREPLVDLLFLRMTTNGAPGLAALVAQDGKVLFSKGYGLANVSAGIPITPQTQFRIGSITKQFTAAAILKLQEQNKLTVEDRLSKFFPDFPRGQEVSLRHLLTHTSGIKSYTDLPGFINKVTAPITPTDLVNSFKNEPYDFAPGEKWHYDNSGYFLLSMVIEKVSGQSYGEFLRKNFFEPLGMRSTGVHRAGAPLEHEALGYSYDGQSFTNALNWDMSWAGGAGTLYSTVEDLYRWNEAIFNMKALSQTSLKAAWTPARTEENKNDSPETGYGFGWGIGQFRRVPEISHGGGLNGFSSMLLRLPDQKFTVVILANALPGAPGADPGSLAHLASEILIGDKLPSRPVFIVDPNVTAKAMDAVVGRYDYRSGVLTVSREGNRLYAQIGSQQRAEIFPKSETEFFWKIVDAQVTFVKDDQGKVVKAIHHQNGTSFNATRLADLTETTVSKADADAIVGQYDYGQGKAVLTVTRDGARVFAQLTGQPKFEIFPKAPNEYFWKVVDAQVTFVKDSHGKVTKAVHHQAGQVLDAPKIQ